MNENKWKKIHEWNKWMKENNNRKWKEWKSLNMGKETRNTIKRRELKIKSLKLDNIDKKSRKRTKKPKTLPLKYQR